MPLTDPTAPKRARTGGSGYTIFQWDGQLIGFARQITHTSPAPVGPGAVPIQPLDARHPIEIITPAAASMGTLVIEKFEFYGKRVWDQLSNIADSNDIVAIFEAVADTPKSIMISKIVKPPKGANVNGSYQEDYYNCVIANVTDGETIEVGTMEILKQITVNYTKSRNSLTANEKNLDSSWKS